MYGILIFYEFNKINNDKSYSSAFGVGEQLGKPFGFSEPGLQKIRIYAITEVSLLKNL
tara:strand:- start:43 stop:216 length:174 start_codon:yes stop_codon:yes gene_type:complete